MMIQRLMTFVTKTATRLGALSALAAGVALLAGCEPGPGKHDSFFSDFEWSVIRGLSPVPPIPPDPTNRVADDPRAAALGQQFFFDPRFSGPLFDTDNPNIEVGGNGPVGAVARISCARCHQGTSSFIDVLSVPHNVSLGTGRTTRNSPTILGTGHATFLNRDGSADSLWAQALGAVESPVLMNFTRLQVVALIFQRYRAPYEEIFGTLPPFDNAARFPQVTNPPLFPGQGRPGDGPGGPGLDTYDEMTLADQLLVDTAFANFGKAIAAYERRLDSRDAPFDRYVAGDESAISGAARRGLRIFIGEGFCINCHSGPRFTDEQFRNIGVAQAGPFVPAQDVGRFGGLLTLAVDRFNGAGPFSDDPQTGRERLLALSLSQTLIGAFRTPGLRSISQTGPYMHAGQLRSLRDVVEFYNRGGDKTGFAGTPDARIGPSLKLDDDDLNDLVAFLQTLTGAPVASSLTVSPVLPP